MQEEVTIPSVIVVCSGGGLLLGNKSTDDLDKKDVKRIPVNWINNT